MATRLRKTFKYPSEEDLANSSDPEELDEQEQESLIAELAQRDQSNTLFYRRAFVALPLAAALLIYLPVFFAATALRHVLLALLSLTALAGSVYILLCVPSAPQAVDGARLSAAMIDARGPLDKALPWLNAGLSAVLALSGLLAWKRDLTDEAWRAFLPGGVSFLLQYTISTCR